MNTNEKIEKTHEKKVTNVAKKITPPSQKYSLALRCNFFFFLYKLRRTGNNTNSKTGKPSANTETQKEQKTCGKNGKNLNFIKS